MTLIKKLAKRIVYKMPQRIKKMVYCIYNSVHYPEMKEKKMSFGEKYPEQIFYVIRPITNSVEGLMALLYSVLLQISYAEIQGYTPVVDYKNYKTQYNIADENAWECFFKQVSPYSLDDVYLSKNVILSGLNATSEAYAYLKDRSCKLEDIKKTHSLLNKYITCSPEVLKLYQKEAEVICPESCIGLYLRGTDYTKLKPVGEPKQPTVEDAIDMVEQYKKKYKLKHVFLVTEDADIYTAVKKVYEDDLKVVSFDKYINNYTAIDFLARDGSLEQLSSDPHTRGLNYLVKILLLSKCRCIVGGKTSGSWAACAFADEGTEFEIFELGEY